MRAQSHVVGVALMLGLAVTAIGALTVGVGTVLDTQASNADANRVAQDLDDAVQGVERTGHHSHRVSFAEGSLGTAERTLRLIKNGSVLQRHRIDAVVFESGDRRVRALAGAVVRGQRGNAWFVSEPPIAGSERNSVLVVGAPVLGSNHTAVSGTGGVTTTLRTNVSHTRYDLGTGTFAVAIETATPGPFERHFEHENATVHRQRFPGDDFESVVARYPGQRQGYLVVHELRLEVSHG